jgi:nitrate/TMAO reductase-like tetraheme cytochrome c subunit
MISLLGAALTTASAVLILTLFGLTFVGYRPGPYAGILTYLILPSFFLLGLLLIPLGAWRGRKRMQRALDRGEPPPTLPVIDLNRGQVRRAILLILAATVVNVTILALATYKGVEVMDSTAFCGTTCHTVMTPEYTTYRNSPHQRVNCVSCHIGPGADWFVKSKLSGTWQLVSVAFDLYPRPIPTPIHDLRPARETCEQCHWPKQFVGDRLKVVTRYAEDEANTEQRTVLLLKVGGIEGRESHGIHWHVDPGIRIRYRGDSTRKTIREIELTRADGTITTYVSGGTPTGDAEEPWRTMDCVDCHNRPTHIFRAPTDEVDSALAQGRIARTLPHIKTEALKVLQADYASHEEARRRIPERIAAFYAENYPALASQAGAVRSAGEAVAEIYCANVFPSMKIGWGTYVSHVGHTNSPGCFRCHDEEHKTAEGKTISQDCSLCHQVLAMEEEKPAILDQLGL